MDFEKTIDLMVSTNYKDRFIAEYMQTKTRYEKLTKYINKISCENVPHDCSVKLLKKQKRHMKKYLSVLERRAIIEQIDLS